MSRFAVNALAYTGAAYVVLGLAPFVIKQFDIYVPKRNEILLAKISKACAEDVLNGQETEDEKKATIYSFSVDDITNKVCHEVCHMSEKEFEIEALEHNRKLASDMNPNYEIKMYVDCDREYPEMLNDMNCDVTFTIKKKT